MSNTSAPLAVAVDPDPLVLERVVTARRLGTYKLKSGNGFGNGHNGENGHGNGYGNGNGNGDHGNGHNGENGGSTGSSMSPSSSQTGLAALSLGFMSGRKPAANDPLFADNPWGEAETATPPPLPGEPTQISPAAPPSSGQFDPVSNNVPSTDNAQGQAPLTPAALPSDPAQGTSPWFTPASQTPFSPNLDPFSSGAQAAQNMFLGAPQPPAEVSAAEPIGAFAPKPGNQEAAEPAPQMMPAAQSDLPLDPFSFDSQSPAASPNDGFYEPTQVLEKTELIEGAGSFGGEASSPYALAPVSSGDDFETATPIQVMPVDTKSGDNFAAVNNEMLPSGELAPEGQTPGSEPVQNDTGIGVGQAAAIAAAAAIAGAAAGAAVTNAIHNKAAGAPGGDFFDAGAPTPRSDATASGSTPSLEEEAAFDPFAPAASKPQAASTFAGGAADDFFSAAPIGKPKRDDGSLDDIKESAQAGMDAFNFDSGRKTRSNDDAFPDESVNRGKRDEQSKLSDTEEVRPKIARPRGFAPSKDSKETIKLQEDKTEKPDKLENQDDDFFAGRKHKKDSDNDSDDEDSDKEAPPPRKSFSGGSSTIKRPGAKKKEVVKDKPKKGKNKDEDSDELDDDENLPFLEREISLGGMTVSNKSAIILGTICAFMTVVVFNTFCTFCTYLAGSLPKNGAAQSGGLLGGLGGGQKAVDISGIYNVFYKTPMERNGNSFKMQLGQQGTQIYGRGEDLGGPWILQGNLVAPNGVVFRKFYLRDGKPFGKGIEYKGMVGVTELGRPYMQGQLSYETKMGKFWRATIAQVSGSWRAVQTVSGAVLATSGQPQPQIPAVASAPLGGGNPLQMLQPNDSHNRGDMSAFFMKIAFLLIGVGVLLAMGALFIFGPSGKLNILAKQEYIPSQYKAQHNKMMREWSKPWKKGAMPLGTRVEWRFWKPWVPRVMAMPPEARTNNPHMIVMGGSDKGKSRLLANMISHDIESNDRAVIVIDSDGELIDLITNWTAAHVKGKELAKRIVIVDPTYRGGSMSYNPLEPLEDVNFIDAASAIVHGFKAIYTEPPGSQSQWNQQTANILRNAAILLMANNKTLIDLPTLLQDNDFRDILLEGIEKKKKERTEYSTLIETWGQYKRLARTDQWINWVEPILNRVTPMLSDPRIRPILTKPVGDLRLKDLIINKQVLLVRIPQGQLDQNANLLGSLLVTGLKQAALGLSVHDSDKQQPCALYLDEMNNFIEKETIEALTQETDKFKIGFVGCCKTLQHLPEDFRNQIIINVGTVCAFALAKKDGDLLGPQMFRVDGRKVKHRTIQNFFNQVNTSPQFELISDEEKLNIDRVVGQETRDFFCYRVGTVAGTFSLRTHEFADPPKAKVKSKLIEMMHTGTSPNYSKKPDVA
ncbi:MAG: type IV secretion system DNA-binding domain-containing protein [Candidatus Obscuribacterales bacterium]|nr:type IV secretion system DNA-binding domain-containing protein [Candidatus Obscuribacterales bacterium]